MNPTGPQDRQLLLLLLGAVLVLVFAGLLYVTHQHPALATPLTVATGGSVAVVTAIGVAIRR